MTGPLNAGGAMGPGGESPPLPRVAPETPHDHAANALAMLQGYREARGLGWHQVLNGPVQIAELSALLEAVEARLRLVVGMGVGR